MPGATFCWRTAPGWARPPWPWPFPGCWGWTTSVSSSPPTPSPRTSRAFPCGTGRPAGLTTGTGRPTASSSWPTRSTVPPPRPSRPCWRSWRSIPSRWMGSPGPCPPPLCASPPRTPLGSSGIQPLLESQLDRFMVRLTIGYPTLENQLKILSAQRYHNPLRDLRAVTDAGTFWRCRNTSPPSGRLTRCSPMPSLCARPLAPTPWWSWASLPGASPRW